MCRLDCHHFNYADVTVPNLSSENRFSANKPQSLAISVIMKWWQKISKPKLILPRLADIDWATWENVILPCNARDLTLLFEGFYSHIALMVRKLLPYLLSRPKSAQGHHDPIWRGTPFIKPQSLIFRGWSFKWIFDLMHDGKTRKTVSMALLHNAY